MRILDVPSYDPEKVKATCVVTLHQFLQYFKDEGGLQNVDAVAAECKNCFIIVRVLMKKQKLMLNEHTRLKYIVKGRLFWLNIIINGWLCIYLF